MTCNGAHMMRQISVHNEDKVTSGILDTVYVGSPYDRKLLNSDATQSGKYVRCTVHTHTRAMAIFIINLNSTHL